MASDPERTKVGRLIERYDLGAEYGDRLERLWTGDGVERRSLRDIADMVNERVLEARLREAGEAPIEGELSNLYRLLTDDDVSSGMRTDAESRLERAGVDVADLRSDFVTYQAVRGYLQARGASYEEPSDEEQVETDREHVQRLRSRTASVTEEKLSRLRETDRITLGEFRLFVDVNVLCEECGAQYSVEELLDRGGCDCES